MRLLKKGAVVRGGLEDKISRLPDEILVHILSLMPTKYSIRTSVLSRRWEHLWILATKLDFEFNLRYYLRHRNGNIDQCVDSFTRSIDNLLFLRDNLCIESFRLSHPWLYFEIDHLRPNSWICGALACNVRELDLNIAWRQIGGLPWMLFTCKTLVVLKVCGYFIVDVPYYVCLPNLKTLVLDGVIFLGDSSIPKLLSGCPVLEDLKLSKDPRGIVSMYDVSHPSLKRLTLHLADPGYGEEEFKRRVKVDAPNLVFIELCGRWSGDLLVNSSPSIVEANMIHKRYYAQQEEITNGEQILAFLKNIAYVECLSLVHYSLRHFFHVHAPNLPKFCNLVQLKIDLRAANFPKQLMTFLECSPKLKVLKVLSLPREIQSKEELDDGGINDEPQRVPECLHASLKSIRIFDFWGKEKEITVVKYLLENTMILEKMTISCGYLPDSDQGDEIKRELTNHPFGSSNCQLEFLRMYS